MYKGYVFILACCLVLSCKPGKRSGQNNNCNDSILVLQKALSTHIIDSLFLPEYKDSILKITKIPFAIASNSCSVQWHGKNIVVDSSEHARRVDPGDFKKDIINGKTLMKGVRLPSFALACDILIINSDYAKVNFIFKNQGIFINYEVAKQNNEWKIIKYVWGEM